MSYTFRQNSTLSAIFAAKLRKKDEPAKPYAEILWLEGFFLSEAGTASVWEKVPEAPFTVFTL